VLYQSNVEPFFRLAANRLKWRDVLKVKDPAAFEVFGVLFDRQVMNLYSSDTSSQIEPPSVARCMIDTYRGMNKHFIPTGY